MSQFILYLLLSLWLKGITCTVNIGWKLALHLLHNTLHTCTVKEKQKTRRGLAWIVFGLAWREDVSLLSVGPTSLWRNATPSSPRVRTRPPARRSARGWGIKAVIAGREVDTVSSNL